MENKNTIRLMYFVDLVFLFLFVIGSITTIQKVGLDPVRHIKFDEKNNQVFVNRVLDDKLDYAFSKGDRLDAINGIKISSKDDLEFIFDRLDYGEKTSVLLNRDGKLVTSTLSIPKYYTDVNIVIRIFVAFIFLISGIYVCAKNQQNLIVKLWYFIALGASIIISCTWGKYNIQMFDHGQISRLAFLIVYAFIPNILIHLGFVFPLPHKIVYKKYLYLLYFFSAIFAAFICYLFLSAIYNNSLEIYHRFTFVFNINRLYFAAAIIFTIINFCHSYIKAEEEIERRKILWLIFGSAIGPLLYAVFHQIPQSFGFNSLVPLEVIVIAMLSIPITFTIAIIKYNLFDVETIVQQSTLYFIVITLLFLLYASLVGFTFLLIGRLDVNTALASSMIAAILIPFILEPIRNFLKKNIDKRFFRKRYNYRLAIDRFSSKLTKCFDQKSTIILVFSEIDNILSPESMGFYLADSESDKIEFKNGVNFKKLDKESLFYLEEIAEDTNSKIICALHCVEAKPDYSYLKEDFIKKNPQAALIISIKNKTGKLDGLLILGNKKSRTKYNSEDIYLLSSIISQVEFEIDRIKLQHKLIKKSVEAKHLEDLNAAKSFFVSSVSHDLQTPLTSIKMFSELLREKKDLSAEKREEFISIIENESERLSRLIKNVLDLSQIERDVKSYNFSPVDLNEMVKTVLSLMKYSLEQNGFKVNQKLSGKPIKINADDDAIISCIVNLISNVMKYSLDRKEIEIKTSYVNGNAILSISDKGIGISKSEQDKIFDTFYRSDNKLTQNVAGVGLGLTIISHVVKAHKGSISLQSEVGHGSTFTLSFPLM